MQHVYEWNFFHSVRAQRDPILVICVSDPGVRSLVVQDFSKSLVRMGVKATMTRTPLDDENYEFSIEVGFSPDLFIEELPDVVGDEIHSSERVSMWWSEDPGMRWELGWTWGFGLHK